MEKQDETANGFFVIMDVLIESWRGSLILSIILGMMIFVGFRIGSFIGKFGVSSSQAASSVTDGANTDL